MKLPPIYPDYREVTPPGKLRWATVGSLFWLLFALVTIVVWPQNRPTQTGQFWFWVIGLPLLLVALLFAVRCLIYHVALSNQKSYREVIQQAQTQWWTQRGQGLPIEHLCLVGPVGDNITHHLAVLQQVVPPLHLFMTAAAGPYCAVLRY
ncbi:hypothetical protein ACQ86O_15475 [Serratia sp. L9]|uniref:hypothetical protein n=1 Tax=Serratia sp. L9 TaxID=3423946 RepID=UPI003D67D452